MALPKNQEQALDWLLREGRHLLQREQAGDCPHPPKLTAWQASILEEQRVLRNRARRRFPDVEKWLWTDRSLSQASDWWSARFKASLFPKAAKVMDACCGAGADLVALAGRCQVTGIDSDARVLRLAAANLKSHGLDARLVCQDFLPRLVTRDDWLHIDPDRRSHDEGPQHRTRIAGHFYPPLPKILPAARMAAGAIVKLAPKTEFTPAEISALSEASLRVWIGNRAECRQQLAVFGKLIPMLGVSQPGEADLRVAVLAEPANPQPCGEVEVSIFAGATDVEVETTTQVQRYVYDYHAVLHASDLQAAWARQRGAMRAVQTTQGYFTSERAVRSPWCQIYEVLDVIAWDDRKVRRALRGLRAGQVEIKNRLIRLDANYYQRKYRASQGQPLTVLVTRIGQRVRAIVARRWSGG